MLESEWTELAALLGNRLSTQSEHVSYPSASRRVVVVVVLVLVLANGHSLLVLSSGGWLDECNGPQSHDHVTPPRVDEDTIGVDSQLEIFGIIS